MRFRRMARYALTGLALAMLGLLPPAGQTDSILILPTEEAEKLSPTEQTEQTDGPLRFRLQEGDLFAYRDKQKIEMTINTPAGAIKMKFEIDSVIEQRVVEVAENGNGIIETKYKEFEVALTNISGAFPPDLPQEEIEQLKEETSRELTESAKALLNEPFKITMTPRGEIKKTEAKEFLTALESIGGDGGPSLDFLNEASLKHNIIAPGLVYPKLDEYFWEEEMQVEEELEGTSITTDIQLNWSRQGDKVVKKIPSHILEFTGEGRMAEGSASIQVEGVNLALNMESFDMEGTIHISKEDRWPVKTKIVNNVVFSMTGEESGTIATVTVQMKQTNTSERLRPDEYDQF